MKFPALPVRSGKDATLNFERLQLLLSSPWVVVTSFEHAWENYEAGARKAEYKKDALGNVMLRGAIKGGENGKSAFILPVGFRNVTAAKEYPVVVSGGTSLVNVKSTGEVVPIAVTGEPKTYCFLDGVYFSTE